MRTLENCKLVRKHGVPKQYDGVCEGFAHSATDDEPAETCKRCKLNYLYKDGEETE
jgi:hypothetical protein